MSSEIERIYLFRRRFSPRPNVEFFLDWAFSELHYGRPFRAAALAIYATAEWLRWKREC